MHLPPIAFVDVETTGLDPTSNRIAEIGVVTVDSDRVTEWSTFIGLRDGRSRPPRSLVVSEPEPAEAPSFKDIAVQLERRLAGRLLIAHNARFDYAFLKAEFQRVRIEFSREVLCTVMLSRRLYPQHARHDLDSLIERHRLSANVRHRALPDAQLLWQFWQAIHRETNTETIAEAVKILLTAPLLPDQLDPALIDRLPEAPGVYVFHDRDDKILHIGEASNLKLHLVDYFRVDRASAKALAIAHRIKRVTWRVTQGMLGARLRRVVLASAMAPAKQGKSAQAVLWQLTPDRHPILEFIPVDSASLTAGDEFFGVFDSERKARNALLRLAKRRYLCHGLLGIPESTGSPCLACADFGQRHACGAKTARLRHLIKAYDAVKALRVAPWPYAGPIGIRERSDIHIFDEWRYLGTGKGESDVHEILQSRPHHFDKEVFAMLTQTLPKLSARRLLDFGPGARSGINQACAA